VETIKLRLEDVVPLFQAGLCSATLLELALRLVMLINDGFNSAIKTLDPIIFFICG
jgi:hypothetical protein